jgi:hypothetical protein
MRKRRPRGERKKACSGCGNENDRLPQRYCRKCQREYMRVYRGKEKEEINQNNE